MQAMVLNAPRSRLRLEERPMPFPSAGEILVRVSACAVCRTDLHVVDGELANAKLPLIPGHEIIGYVEACGLGVTEFAVSERVGIPWLGGTCQACAYCHDGRENLCDRPIFTGYTRDGGFASHVTADAKFAFRLPTNKTDSDAAPLMCAGLIGWRCLTKAGAGRTLGLYGFGAAAHLVAQVARWQGRDVYAFTRPGDTGAQNFAKALGCAWVGGSDEAPPVPLDATIIFAPVGALVPAALRATRKGGRVVCGGIHMSDIPQFPYRLLWEEREICSVANLTRVDAHDFLKLAAQIPIEVKTTIYPLENANEALADLREGRLNGAAVLVPGS
ncbi:MAG: zinc-dependent alcohol dehydrogenase family protein [Alphaproteobacteria bacterium]|nr:zinc-dependent alcohol dehydrogenase family protein [Alphaproteobacteria bacterium]